MEDWFFVGFVKDDEFLQAKRIAKSYKCNVKGDMYSNRAMYIDNAFRVSSIRNKLWGHRWAYSCDWLAENPGMENFDPTVKVKRPSGKPRGTVKTNKNKTKG
tara:strand:- start:440 stop:745 length:306 start_codon:yes stop_codon:yes gene_type:complete